MLLEACFFYRFQLNRKLFNFLLAKSNFQFLVFGVLFSIIYFSIYKFCAKNFSFLFSSFCWQISILSFCFSDFNFQVSASQNPTFQVTVGRFQFSSFCFSVVNFISFCFSNSNFPASVFIVSAETKVHF